jgi:hypothetical protein
MMARKTPRSRRESSRYSQVGGGGSAAAAATAGNSGGIAQTRVG